MNCAPKDETLIPIEMFHKIHANPGEEDTVRGISWDSFLPVSIWISGADDFVQEERESQALPLCFSMGGRGRLRREMRGEEEVPVTSQVDPVHTFGRAERPSCATRA